MMHYRHSQENGVVGRLLNVFVDICLLRAGPQRLPSSSFLLLLTAVLSLVTGTLAIVDSFGTLATALVAQTLDIMLLLGLIWIGLGLFHKRGRFFQTGAALCGSSALLNLATMPLQLFVGEDPSGSLARELGVLVYLVLIVWALVVMGHIARHAFDIRFSGGILLALSYFLGVSWLVQLFFPVG